MVDGRRVYRITFSKSLADHMVRALGCYEVKRVTFRVGRELLPGEASRSQLYALVSKRSGAVLRISMVREIAEELCDYDSRYLAECWLT